MPRSGWFERRLLIALVLFSLVPTLVLVGIGTLVLREAVSLQTTPAGWERLGETGRVLLERAESSGDAALIQAAESHRKELTNSIQQAQRWGYLNRRALAVIPWIALAFLAALAFSGVRSARRIARALARPIAELVGWSRLIARGEPLPPAHEEERRKDSEFGVLRQSFRAMATELAESQEREMEAARVRASVALARGVAHELKNALTPLRFAVRALRSDRTMPAAAREPLEVIDVESERLESLARAFSQLGRPPEGVHSTIDLTEMLDYLGRTHLGPTIAFQLESQGPAFVDGHHDALSRAFANLILNAAEAMGDEGSLRIAVVPREGSVEVLIADSGPGIPAGARDRIWDPDFTTKPRGTGLGLALVRQTIHTHCGRIAVREAPGGGAEFVVTLPLGSGLADVAAAPVHALGRR